LRSQICMEGRQIQAGCTCPENRIGFGRGRSVTDAFRQPSPAGLGLAGELNPQPEENNMTIIQYLPQWARDRLKRPRPRSCRATGERDQKVPQKGSQTNPPATPSQENRTLPGERLLWRL
jgi:hypothetical protein